MRVARHDGFSRCWRRLPHGRALLVGHGRHRNLKALGHTRGEHRRRPGHRQHRRETRQPLKPSRHVREYRSTVTETLLSPTAVLATIDSAAAAFG